MERCVRYENFPYLKAFLGVCHFYSYKYLGNLVSYLCKKTSVTKILLFFFFSIFQNDFFVCCISSYGRCSKLPSLVAENNLYLLSYSSGDQKSKMNLVLKANRWQGWIPPEAYRKVGFLALLASGSGCISLLVIPSLHHISSPSLRSPSASLL